MCAFCYMLNFCSVVVFHASMLNWRRRLASVYHGYMCILQYMTLIWCSGVAHIYAHLEEGVGLVFHGYGCILLYKNLMQ